MLPRSRPAARRAASGAHARAALVLGLAAAGAGCATMQPTTRPTAGLGAPNVPGGGRATPGATAGRDSGFFARGRDRRAAAQSGAEGVRRVCRAGAWPRGWVAVAYEPAGGPDGTGTGCPGPAATAQAPVAVLVRHDRSPLGTRLDVCADQPTPVRWARADGEAPGSADACPGAAPEGQPSVRRIVRVQ